MMTKTDIKMLHARELNELVYMINEELEFRKESTVPNAIRHMNQLQHNNYENTTSEQTETSI
jgi:hypothetical protein